jgi:hypothetical protein
MHEEIERKKEKTKSENEISSIIGRKLGNSLNLTIYVLIIDD